MQTIDPFNGLPLPNDQVRYSISRSIADIEADLSNPRVLTASSILSKLDGTSAVKITLQYAGYTLVPIAASQWDVSNGGWFSAAPIASAYANQNKNVTGYHFIADPGQLQAFAFSGTFGMLTNLVISNFPVVTLEEITPPAAARSTESPELLSFLAVLGLADHQVQYRTTVESDPVTGRLVTTCTPSATELSLADVREPIPLQSAYVVGCTINNPAVTG